MNGSKKVIYQLDSGVHRVQERRRRRHELADGAHRRPGDRAQNLLKDRLAGGERHPSPPGAAIADGLDLGGDA